MERRRWGLVLLVFFAMAGVPRLAIAADDGADYQQKATTAFALGKYAVAAENFEKAYEASPDPSLLYNAAQAYRLAGNKERALTLYENYLRVYGGGEKRADIEARIAELKKAVENDKMVTTRPPNDELSVGAAPGAAAPPPPAAPPAQAAPVLVSAPASNHDEEKPLTSKPWFWGVVGGGVVVAVVVGILVASGGSKDPVPSIGKVNGN
jgi:tetratricopeptide (TPR) repeat protein